MSKKLSLSLDDLQVESFHTTPEKKKEGQGTVYGYITQDLTLCDTCTDSTCGSTCDSTCSSTCSSTGGSTCSSTCSSTCDSTCDSTCSGCGGGTTCLGGGCNTDFACFYCTTDC